MSDRHAGWLAALPGLLCLLLALAPDALQEALAWQREAVATGEVWRLWTAHFVHFGPTHALAGAATLTLLGLAATRTVGPALRRTCAVPDLQHTSAVCWLLVLTTAAPLVSLALLPAAPEMAAYRGASAVAMSGLTWLAVRAAVRGSRWAGGILAVLIAAVALEAGGVAMPLSSLPAGVAVAWQAHALGLATGIALAGVATTITAADRGRGTTPARP